MAEYSVFIAHDKDNNTDLHQSRWFRQEPFMGISSIDISVGLTYMIQNR